MNRVSPKMRNVAAFLIAEEAKRNRSAARNPPAVFHVCEKLRPHLGTLMGKAGFRALLSRALAVAGAELPWLTEIEVDTDGALEGWDKPKARVTAKELTEAGVLLVAKLLGLLVAFIGGDLTLRLVRDVWPKLSLEDVKFTEGDAS